MSRRRAIDRLPDAPGPMTLGPEHHQHLVRVMRMKIGDRFTLFDRKGREGSAKITQIRQDGISVMLKDIKQVNREPRCRVTLAFAMSKGEKPDLVLQKGTELGVARFLIFLSERSVARPESEKIKTRLARWKKIVDAACAQSGRNDAPGIGFYPDMPSVLKKIDTPLRLILDPESEKTLSQAAAKTPDAVALLIGPEGGLTESEIDLAVKCGFLPVTFGRRILRAETAALAAVVPFVME